MTAHPTTADRLAIRAIPTTYNGIRYRSRLEARWAYFFTKLDVRFEYELQGYQTPVGWYLPDFWLPDWHLFAEVKPETFTREQKAKCAAVSHGTGFGFLLLPESPRVRWYEAIQPDGRPEWLDMGASVDKGRPWYAFAGPEYPGFDVISAASIQAAADLARSARFAA